MVGRCPADPLGVLGEALGIKPHNAGALTTNEVLKRVEQLCVSAPLVLVVDDLHQADEASRLVFNQLCATTKSLPLLLIGVCRSDEDNGAFAQLRRVVSAREDALVVTLRPLSVADSMSLVRQAVGATQGPVLHALAAAARGNPLVLQATLAALVRDTATGIGHGSADMLGDGGGESLEQVLVAAMITRLGLLSDPATETLRSAAVLGMRFTTTELATMVTKWPSELLGVFDEAIRAKVLVPDGDSLAFGHVAQRRALYASIPPGVLPTLHRCAARALADVGAPVQRVCEQLAAVSDGRLPPWVIDWLVTRRDELATCGPMPTVWVLNHVLDACPAEHPHRATLLATRASLPR